MFAGQVSRGGVAGDVCQQILDPECGPSLRPFCWIRLGCGHCRFDGRFDLLRVPVEWVFGWTPMVGALLILLQAHVLQGGGEGNVQSVDASGSLRVVFSVATS